MQIDIITKINVTCKKYNSYTIYQLVEYLNNGSVIVSVMGKQYIRKSAVAGKKSMHTKELIKSDRGVFSKYNLIIFFKKMHRSITLYTQFSGRPILWMGSKWTDELLILTSNQWSLNYFCWRRLKLDYNKNVYVELIFSKNIQFFYLYHKSINLSVAVCHLYHYLLI